MDTMSNFLYLIDLTGISHVEILSKWYDKFGEAGDDECKAGGFQRGGLVKGPFTLR